MRIATLSLVTVLVLLAALLVALIRAHLGTQQTLHEIIADRQDPFHDPNRTTTWGVERILRWRPPDYARGDLPG